MNDGVAPMLSRAQALRRAFDQSFAQAPRSAPATRHDLLAIRLGRDAYAIRLPQLAGIFADKVVTRLPHTDAACLGIAGFRGALVPVYDLRVLLGHPGAATPRWLALASFSCVAVAFDALDGYLRVPQEQLAPRTHDDAAQRPHVRELVHGTAATALRPVIDLVSIVATIEQRTHGDHPLS